MAQQRHASRKTSRVARWVHCLLRVTKAWLRKFRRSAGSIGYVEFWYAQRFGLRKATLQNKAGKFITPKADAGDLALSGRVALVKQLGAIGRRSVHPRRLSDTLIQLDAHLSGISRQSKRGCAGRFCRVGIVTTCPRFGGPARIPTASRRRGSTREASPGRTC